MQQVKRLVIVESPAKARTIGSFLGEEYTVVASVGHIRDLAEPSQLPGSKKKGSLARFGVDIEHGFLPYYTVNADKKKTVSQLKKALKDADELWLATDEDREGEAIAWHLCEVLKPKVPVHRMVFHEITQEAIARATESTRDLNTSLVDAQEARRVLDRLYGYDVSPVLWRKIAPRLSAGRVQSAATRIVVNRERERISFVRSAYCSIGSIFATEKAEEFSAKLISIDGKKIATGQDFSSKGELKDASRKHGVQVLDQDFAQRILEALQNEQDAKLVARETRPYRRKPAAPFTTSTLQQEASRKLRFSSRQTMMVAQSLYEHGYITYMRTDSTQLSDQAISAARTQAAELYGADQIPPSPRIYKSKAKGAQEAHEAIRPAGESFRTPESLRSVLQHGEYQLYKLIWKRTVASQMIDATGSTDTFDIAVSCKIQNASHTLSFHTSGTVITSPGFMLAYEEGRDDQADTGSEDKESARLPKLEEGASLRLRTSEINSHETMPPARFTEASLTKRLEELGIGRPSTYASTLSTIMDRGYVEKRGQALVPTWTAFAVVRLLESHFSELVDLDFTASMEADLDKIASGKVDRASWLHDFYFGTDAHPGLRGVVDNLGEIDARAINTFPIDDTISLRTGRYGAYLEVRDEECERLEDGTLKPRTVAVPNGILPDELTVEKAHEIVDTAPLSDRVIGVHPQTGRTIVAKVGRFGPYVSEVLAEGEKLKRGEKLLSASLFKNMSIETLDLQDALKLLSLPRVVGQDPETQEDILAQNGKYGPYLTRGKTNRSLQSEEEIFTITLEEALELFSQPNFRRRSSSPSYLQSFDTPDPMTGKRIVVRDGRFGPYVTDGTVNVTCPKTLDPHTITLEQASDLLAKKRAQIELSAQESPKRKTAKTRAGARGGTKKKTASKGKKSS